MYPLHSLGCLRSCEQERSPGSSVRGDRCRGRDRPHFPRGTAHSAPTTESKVNNYRLEAVGSLVCRLQVDSETARRGGAAQWYAHSPPSGPARANASEDTPDRQVRACPQNGVQPAVPQDGVRLPGCSQAGTCRRSRALQRLVRGRLRGGVLVRAPVGRRVRGMRSRRARPYSGVLRE